MLSFVTVVDRCNPKSYRVSNDIITIIVTSSCANTLKYLDLSRTDVTVDIISMLLNSLSNLKRCKTDELKSLHK